MRRSSEFWTSKPSATRIVPVILHRKWFLEWIEHSDYKHGHLSQGFRAHTLSQIQLRARPKFLPSSARSEITWTVTLGYFGNISTKHNKTWENNQEEFATHFGVHSRSVTWGMRTQDPSSAMPLTISRKLLRWSSTWYMCIAHHSASLRIIAQHSHLSSWSAIEVSWVSVAACGHSFRPVCFSLCFAMFCNSSYLILLEDFEATSSVSRRRFGLVSSATSKATWDVGTLPEITSKKWTAHGSTNGETIEVLFHLVFLACLGIFVVVYSLPWTWFDVRSCRNSCVVCTVTELLWLVWRSTSKHIKTLRQRKCKVVLPLLSATLRTRSSKEGIFDPHIFVSFHWLNPDLQL